MGEAEQAGKLEVADLRAILDDPLALDEREDVAEVVSSLPEQSFVRITRRLREEQRLDLVLPNATPDQLVTLLDLDAWERDRMDVARARRWLVAIGDAYIAADRPRGALVDLIYAMDPEFWTLALWAGTQVVVLDPEDDQARDAAFHQLAERRVWETPDGAFVVGVPDDEQGLQTLRVLRSVYEDDLVEGRKLVLSIHAALPAEIEDTLSRFRSGRLADLGFVAWDDAMRLFRPLDHKAAADLAPRDFQWLGTDELGAQLTTYRGNELLARVMARLEGGEHGVRAREFLLLVNEVIAAQRLPPGDEAVQERGLDQTQATLGLGLELLAQARPGHPDPDGFLAERVAAIGLRDVFRVGYGALDRLRRAALALHRATRVSLASVGSLLDRPWGPAIAASIRWYPELALDATQSGSRPIRGLVDVARATERIAEAGALAQLTYHAKGYGIDPVWVSRLDEPEKVVLGDLIRTAIVHAHLPASRSSFAPLTPADLAWAREHLLDGGQLVDSVRRDLSARADELGIGRHTNVLADNLLTRLRVELLGLELKDGVPDLVRVGGLVTIQSVSMWLTVETTN
ncbi:MAG TPA: DUF6178 family protein [Nannocystaceae bacterium]|nr:DUF6178 family protein [Nannocystaceae bacterium]